MADTVPITAGSGTSIATDDIASVHYQRVKITLGADGVNDGDLASGNPMPVAEGGAALTALQLIDDAIVADDAAFTPATTKVMMAGFEFDDTTPDSVNEGDAGAARMSANRNVYVQIRDAAGNERGANVNASGQIAVAGPVTNAGTFAVQVDGAALTALQLIDDVVLAEDAVHSTGASGIMALTVRRDTPAATSGTDGDYQPLTTDNLGRVHSFVMCPQVTVTTSVTRPVDTTAYTANDCWADSTASPTTGGFTFTNAARISGGSGIITDAMIVSSANPGTLLQGQIHIFDTAVTAVNDNAAYSITDAEALTLVGVIPFTLNANNLNSFHHVQNLSIGFTASGSANLRFLIKVLNAYTPASGEVLTVRLKILQTT